MFQADVYKIMIGAPSDIIEEVDIAINVFKFRNPESSLPAITLVY